MIRLLSVVGVLLLPAATRADAGADFFEAKVRPLFAAHCYSCHSAGAKKVKGGLSLDTPSAVRRGGDSGPDLALIVQAVGYDADAPAMPPSGKLPADALGVLREWAGRGYPMPAGAAATATNAPTAATGRDFWSFGPVREQPAPATSDPKWATGKLDHFVLAKLDEQGFAPAPPASPRALLRRLHFDLTGLPPTPDELASFEPSAIEAVVDRLLASPRFGEKWGRHWLDVARYAEDNSTGESTCKPPRFPFRYRDWVIRALNADLPYREFVRRQLAADLIPGTPPDDLAALGFLGLAPVYHKEPKLSKDVIAAIVADEWDERLDTITRGFLGLTVACARCHDHKFDPISAEDYTALAGVMANTQLAERPLTADADADAEELTTVRLRLVDVNLRLSYAKEMRSTAKKEKGDPAPFEARAKAFEAELADLKAREKKLFAGPIAPGVRDAATTVNGDDPAWTAVEYHPGAARDLPVFVRGNPAKPGAVVPRRFLAALSPEAEPFRHGSGRRELADAIVGDAAGLTARVFVNRAWGWLFGRGLVTTPSNFGVLGDRPTHPELLDDLAARFAANGWSVKWLVREMVLSSTYRQSARPHPAFAKSDPDNRFLWRAPVKRLEAEQWRDAMLQISGRLDPHAGGPSDDLDRVESVRRTVYGKVSRQRASDIHRLFDLPDPKSHGEKREPTTTPVQQLYFLNSPFVRRSAEALAGRLDVGETEPAEAVRQLYRETLLREPTAAELAAGLALERPVLAQVLLASNEFLFLE